MTKVYEVNWNLIQSILKASTSKILVFTPPRSLENKFLEVVFYRK